MSASFRSASVSSGNGAHTRETGEREPESVMYSALAGIVSRTVRPKSGLPFVVVACSVTGSRSVSYRKLMNPCKFSCEFCPDSGDAKPQSAIGSD